MKKRVALARSIIFDTTKDSIEPEVCLLAAIIAILFSDLEKRSSLTSEWLDVHMLKNAWKLCLLAYLRILPKLCWLIMKFKSIIVVIFKNVCAFLSGHSFFYGKKMLKNAIINWHVFSSFSEAKLNHPNQFQHFLWWTWPN